ncbi:MAG: hypothetical protein P4N59_11580 [Negativicutes bacterium]|nr:hypothetical protein [Negativicutes bacterium]
MKFTSTPRFTHKHYEAIAEAMRKADLTPETRQAALLPLVQLFRADNPRFIPTRFRQAATPEA